MSCDRCSLFLRAYTAALRHELRGTMLWLLLLFVLASLLLIGISRPILAGMQLSSSDKEDDDGQIPDSFRYKVSLVSSGNPLITGMVRSQMEAFPLIQTVFLESEEEAAVRLSSGETLLSVSIPAVLIQEIGSGPSEEAITIRLSQEMPEEARRLASIFRSLGHALSVLHASAFTWQDLYIELTGDEAGSWNKMTQFAFQEIKQIRERSGLIRLRSVSPYLGISYFLASITLLLSIVPSILLFERRGASLESSFRDKIQSVGAGPAVSLAEVSAHVLLTLILLLPLSALLWRLYGYAFLLRLLPLTVTASLIAIFLAAALCSLGFPPALRASAAWLFMLLLFYSAGGMYPSELMPPWIQKIFSLSPLYAVFRSMMLLFARSKGTLNWLQATAWLIPAASCMVFAEQKRWKV